MKLKKQAEYCRLTGMLLHEARLIMRYSCETLPVLIGELVCRESFAPLVYLQRASECINNGVCFPAAWRDGMTADHNITQELRLFLEPLADSLGASDIDGQLMTLALAEEQLQELHRAAQEKYAQKGRLYRCLGILLGMSAALLIW